MNLTDILGDNLKDNTEQVKAEPVNVAPIPEASPLQEVAPTRPPDSWLIDQDGKRIPTWSTDVDIKPKWKSKIFITQVVTFASVMIATFTSFSVAPEMQETIIKIISAIVGGGGLATTIFRFFYTDKKLT